MHIEPLGDQAVLITCRNEDEAATLAQTVRAKRPDWLVDIVLAYQSVALFYELAKTTYGEAAAWCRNLAALSDNGSGRTWSLRGRRSKKTDAMGPTDRPTRLHTVPCCYELGPDLASVSEQLRLSVDEIIRYHSSQPYRIFAIGFSPGFPYLGYLPAALGGLPRLDSPRKRVEPGSVGVTGRQTCVYPSATPGGWRLIGRTPRILVDLEGDYFPLRPGDFVQFLPITSEQFEGQRGLRLDPPSEVPLKNVRQPAAQTA